MSYHSKMTGCGRRSPTKTHSILFPCSPSVLLPLCLFVVYLFSLARGVSIGGGGPGELVEPLPQQPEEESNGKAVAFATAPSRVKRSRDVQQLCGYRLLDALRSVCDRNFVGFTRRSDPSFLNGGDGLSGEDAFIGNAGNMNPWEVALLTLEAPASPSAVGGDMLFPSSNNWGDGGVLDYLESQQPSVVNPIFPWTTATRSNGQAGVGRSTSSKSIALKMLAEPPKTHQRFRRNIIDECCKKPCAMNQMLKYCAITAVGKRSF